MKMDRGRIMRLSELSGKEIVDLNRAERLGVLGQTDLEINERNGQIEALIIPQMGWFEKKKQEIRVDWNKIKKIGTDMIFVIWGTLKIRVKMTILESFFIFI